MSGSRYSAKSKEMSSGTGESIAVKAICGDDVRRFHLPQGAGFESLRDQIMKRFALEGKRVALKFKDDENEWCSLTVRPSRQVVFAASHHGFCCA